MKIVADENIVAVDEHFRAHGELILLPGRSISAQDVRDADVLLIRSITRVDRDLLHGSSVRFVATATSGTDHVDLDYLASAGIGFADAAGSNANAVVEYCLAGVAELICNHRFSLRNKCVAIIGFGHVGSALYRRLRELEVACVVCDPFVEKRSREVEAPGNVSFCDLETALSQPVVSLHTPLTRSGEHPTWHLLNESRLARLTPGTLLINASRGEVVDNLALQRRLAQHQDLLTLWDVWENEPGISLELLEQVTVATPHIAGYSVEAKRSASEMNYRSFLQYFGLESSENTAPQPESRARIAVNLTPTADNTPDHDEHCLAECLRAAFLVADIDRRLRAGHDLGPAALFDGIRKTLVSRREFRHFYLDRSLVASGALSEAVAHKLTQSGFVFR